MNSAEIKPTIFPLWCSRAPYAKGDADCDTPSVAAFMPDGHGSDVPAVVICPGGGYALLAPHEGEDYARFLCRNGMAAFVLKYRLGVDGYRHPAMLEDAKRAMRFVRANSSELGVDGSRLGIMGSSAGGHLAATLMTHFDKGNPDDADPVERESSRPDFGILCYPVISMRDELTHRGSRELLIGNNPDESTVRFLSAELNVTHDTPKCFIWHTGEDRGVDPRNSVEFALALKAHDVPFDLHIYQRGGHGLGLGDSWPYDRALPWAADLTYWLKSNDIL